MKSILLLLVCVVAFASVYAPMSSASGQVPVQLPNQLSTTTQNVTVTQTSYTSITESHTSTAFSTTTQTTTTNQTSTNTVLTSTTLTFPTIIQSTTVISQTQTNIISLTITTTQTTNVLAFKFSSEDYTPIAIMAGFIVLAIVAIIIYVLAGRGEKRNGIKRETAGIRRQ